VEEAAKLLSISRSRTFELLRSGRLQSVTEGRARLISHRALVEFVNELEREVG
jgi:excisionase family DNA binding protein